MYLVAGSVTVLWSIAIFFLLPSDPIRAKGFTDRGKSLQSSEFDDQQMGINLFAERYIAVARMRSNNAGVRNTHFKIEHLWDALGDLKFWLAFSMSFLLMIANGPVSSFTPIIINGFGFVRLPSLFARAETNCHSILDWLDFVVAYYARRVRQWYD